MKLRIRGNTIRLRLTQGEVDTFLSSGRVEEFTHLGPGERLVYALEASATASDLAARFDGGRLTVFVPEAAARDWATTEQVGLEGEQPVEAGTLLSILVEKDFECLHRRPTEDDADTFPHPLAEG